jgi:tRNA U38,U39,U40 pseudouridine synthase TruA
VSSASATGGKPHVRPPKGGRRYRLAVAYDGTDFHGWQAQPNKATVQGALEAALKQLTGETIRVHSCGRTDTGVHARAQVAHFDLKLPWETRRLQHGLNALLPDAVRALDLRRTRPTFHARYDAKGKEYGFPSGTRRSRARCTAARPSTSGCPWIWPRCARRPRCWRARAISRRFRRIPIGKSAARCARSGGWRCASRGR